MGGLWERTSRAGALYMTGTIQGVRIVIFRNTRKQNDRQPDWRVLRDVRRERPADDPPAAPAPVDADEAPGADDIPF